MLVVLLIKKCCKQGEKKKGIENGSRQQQPPPPQQQETGNKPKLKDQLEYIRSIKKGKFTESFFGCRLGEKLFIKQFSKKAKQNWLNEAEVYSLPLLRHENVVDFVGKDHLLVVTVFGELGSLTNYLNGNRNLTEGQMIRLMLSAAQGLNHLHQDLEFKPSIVHRNLNSDNYIVCVDGGEPRCKLTNFSNALTYTRFECLEKEMKLKQLKSIVCDLRYCAPEYFNQKINYKNFISFQAADTYSFSLVLWQIANHQEDPIDLEPVEQLKQVPNSVEQSSQPNQGEQSSQTNQGEQSSQPNQGEQLSQTNQDDSECLEEVAIGNGENALDDRTESNVRDEDDSNEENLPNQTSSDGQVDCNEQILDSANRCDQAVQNDELNQTGSSEDNLECRYSKPYEEYLIHDNKRSEYDQMKELLVDDSFITRPTIYFDASRVRTFNGYVIPKLIDESWSFEYSSRLSIARIVKDLTNLYNTHLIKTNKRN